MAVLHYQTEWGCLIIVEDDDALTLANSIGGTIELINVNSVDQAAFTTYSEGFHFSEMYPTIIYNDTLEFNQIALSNVVHCFPNALFKAMPIYNETVDVIIPFGETSYSDHTQWQYSSGYRYKKQDNIYLNNDRIFYSWQSHGGFLPDMGYGEGTNASLSFEFIVTDTAHSKFININIGGKPNNGYQWNKSGIELMRVNNWTSSSDLEKFNAFMNTVPPLDPTAEYDPYSEGGESGEDGGEGTFDHTGDDIDVPNLPSVSATDAGFITLFNPSSAQLLNLANYMWGTGFDLDTFKKIFANPMDCILGLSIVPVAVPNGGTATVKVGNISTGVSMTKAASQYVSVDCGSLTVKEYWGAYLDYDPYTKMEIYLPYIGTHPIRADDVMGKTIKIVYHIDILSGACTAYIKCGNSVLYEFIGQCSSSIPITSNDWTNVVNGVLSIAGAIGSMVATGGASAPATVPNMVASAINTFKPNIEKSGSMSGTGGMLAIQKPYLIMTFPRQALPKNQNRFVGYPSFITESLDGLSGYTEIETIHLQNVPATIEELNEIEGLLKGGVIF